MPPSTLIILGALPWADPAPIRVARWSDLVRARPAVAATEPDPLVAYPALVAAYHALTHRVARVVLANPSRADSAALTRMLAPDGVVLVCDPEYTPEAGAALSALTAADPGLLVLVSEADAWPPALIGKGFDPIEVLGHGAFTPPGRFKAYPLSGSALAVPLVLGAVSQLGPLAILSDQSKHTQRIGDPQALRLFADVRGVIRLSGAIPRPGRPATTLAEPAPADADAAIMRSLERAMNSRLEAYAFSRQPLSEAKLAADRELRPILKAALTRGDITAFSLEILIEAGQLVVDARIRAPRRVKTVQLTINPMEPPNT